MSSILSTPLSPALLRQPAAKIDALTSLRFFAAAAILLYHLDGMFGLPSNFALYFPGDQTVSFFFVLSGFILCYVYPTLDRHTAPRFFLARFARLWPAHIAALVLLLLITPPVLKPLLAGQTLLPFLANVAMVHSWIPYPQYTFSFNGPSWSIATEFGFYILFPLLLWNQPRTWWLKLLLSIGLIAGLIAFCNLRQLPFDSTTALNSSGLVGFNPLARLFEFVLGMSAATLWRIYLVPSRWSPVAAAIIEFLVLSAALAEMAWNNQIANYLSALLHAGGVGAFVLNHAGINSLFFAALIAVFALQRGPISRLLAAPLLVLLGEISYSIYLLHQFIFLFFSAYTRAYSRLPAWFVALEISLLVILLAHLVWLLIERPTRTAIVNLGSKYLLRTPRKPAPAKPREPFTGWRWITASAAALILLIAANVYIIFIQTSIHRVSDSEAQTLLDRSRPDLRDITFGRSVTLRGLTSETTADNTTFNLLWQTRASYPLAGAYGIHLLDANGKMIGQLDYPLDCARNTVPANTQWIDRIVIPRHRYPNVVTLAICLVEPPSITSIDKGPRDWDNHRLLIPLTP